MEILTGFGLWGAGAVVVVGLVQWAKNLWPAAPRWAWMSMLPLFAFVAAFAASGFKLDSVWDALGIWAIAQLGYELIIQVVKNKLSK